MAANQQAVECLTVWKAQSATGAEQSRDLMLPRETTEGFQEDVTLDLSLKDWPGVDRVEAYGL